METIPRIVLGHQPPACRVYTTPSQRSSWPDSPVTRSADTRHLSACRRLVPDPIYWPRNNELSVAPADSRRSLTPVAGDNTVHLSTPTGLAPARINIASICQIKPADDFIMLKLQRDCQPLDKVHAANMTRDTSRKDGSSSLIATSAILATCGDSGRRSSNPSRTIEHATRW